MAKKNTIGGQAIIEGVMMVSDKRIALAIQKPDKIHTVSIDRRPLPKILKLPFIRGTVSLIEMLIHGTKALIYSANQSTDEDNEDLSIWEVLITLIIGFGLALLLFKLVPLWISQYLYTRDVITNNIIFNSFDGILRIAFFIIYILIIGRNQEVKRIFSYHGAEHKAVHCYEDGKELTISNIKKYGTQHPRCGTGFIMLVLILFILFFSLIPISTSFFKKFIIRLILLPIIAGISYEIIKLSDKRKGFVKFITKPGMWLQKLTTSEPTDEQIKVAIAALKEVNDGNNLQPSLSKTRDRISPGKQKKD